MATKTRHYESSFTLDELETTLNTDESDLDGQLQSLVSAKNTNGEDVTEAVYDKSKKTNLGNLTVKKSPAGSVSGKKKAFDGTAFIEDEDKDVSVFR